MPNLVSPLDQSKAYFACPICERAGTPGVQMTRESHLFKCPFGHQLNGAELSRFKLTMTPISAITTEQPNPESVKWPIYVMPQTRAVLEQKFSGRLHVTMATLCDALASDSVIFVSGGDADKLRAKGLKNGSSIVAAIESSVTLERERDEAIRKLTELMGILNQAGITG